MTRTHENRLLPMSAVIAMLVVSTTIVGLAYWVGDSIAPGLAAIVPVSTGRTASGNPPVSAPLREMGTPSTHAERTNRPPTAPTVAKRTDDAARP